MTSGPEGHPPRLATDTSGAVMVEFAFLAPLLLLLLLGTIEVARFLVTRSALEGAIAATIRHAIIDSSAGEAELRAVLDRNASGFDPALLAEFSVTRMPEPATPLTRITIRATLGFQPIVTLLLPNPLRIESIAEAIAGS
jgi:Flp pilus assembly protein TadG